jgi:pilus assembly protein CpaE
VSAMPAKIKILIVDDIPEARENLKKLISFEPDFDVVGAAGSGRDGIEMARELNPEIVLMDINMPDIDGITATSQLRKSNPTIGVIMMSAQDGSEYIRRAMAAGAKDFLPKPLAVDEVYATIRRVYEDMEQIRNIQMVAVDTKSGQPKTAGVANTGRETKIICVYSPQGGAGKTTIATNMAAGLMREGVKVLLIDADFQFGDVSVFLNLKPQSTVVDLMQNINDIDADLIENVLVTHDSGLRVLCAPARPEEADLIAGDRVPELIEKFKGMFDYVVIDMRTQLDDLALALFDLAERVLLVMNPTLPAVKNTLAVVNLFDSLEYPTAKTVFVINRVTAELERAKITIAVGGIEAKLKRQSLAVIPMDEKKVLYSVNRGISIIAKDKAQSPAKELLALADAMIANIAPAETAPDPALGSNPQQPRSRLGRLFGN